MGRSVPEVPARCIVGLPLFDLRLRWHQRREERPTDHWARRNAAFCRAVVRHGFGRADTVYAFNGAALEIFRAAKQRGLYTVLDQTAAPWRWNARLLRRELERWPGWEDRPAELDESGILSDREEAEWELADAILCGSDFCRAALIESGVPSEKCQVVRFPSSIPNPRARGPTMIGHTEPLRILFVGTLQLRKGVQYLYDAVVRLSTEKVQVRLVGPSLLTETANRKLSEKCTLVGAVPRSDIMVHYEWADVFVLPTLSEGSANVCYEAMAAGLPVITTAAAGSMLRHGVDGLIVRQRSTSELCDAIEYLITNPTIRSMLGRSALTSIATAPNAADMLESVWALHECP